MLPYLFNTIYRKTDAYPAEHPDQKVLRMGVGDVTLPLCDAVIKALHEAVDDQTNAATFHGYMPEGGAPFLRKAIAGYYKGMGAPAAESEIFVSSGACDDLGGILELFDQDNTVMVMNLRIRNMWTRIFWPAETSFIWTLPNRTVDLSPVRDAAITQLSPTAELNTQALTNPAPRLRMMTVYAVAAAENRLVAGTGNRSETYVGYFTKLGDGAHDFNPIADLTVTEIYEFLRFLNAPACIIERAPSAGLFDGRRTKAKWDLLMKCWMLI